jgi:DNA-binding CsgD family transcriptional regulator
VQAAYAASVRLVADGVDADTLTTATTLGPLAQLGVVQVGLYAPTRNEATGRATGLNLLGQFHAPGFAAAPKALTLAVAHPACQAFKDHEVIDHRIGAVGPEFPLKARYAEQLQDLGCDLSKCRLMALPVEIQAVTHGVLTLLMTTAPDTWGWADVELLRGTVWLLAAWLRLAELTNLLEASGILGKPRTGAKVHISERQQVILQALRDGRSNPSIATTLGFSVSTVKQDISALQKMLGARNRHEVVQRAVAVGLLTTD